MRLLLDTSVILRMTLSSEPLHSRLEEAILTAPEILVSSISRAEIGIKLSIGKLHLRHEEHEFWRKLVSGLQAQELPFTSPHAALIADMPLIHRDPFDRMIVAQCLSEDLSLATTDYVFAEYGVKSIM